MNQVPVQPSPDLAARMAVVEEEKTHCETQLREWREKLKKANEQVRYWECQFDAARVVSTRLMLDDWKAKQEAKEASDAETASGPSG